MVIISKQFKMEGVDSTFQILLHYILLQGIGSIYQMATTSFHSQKTRWINALDKSNIIRHGVEQA